jgi:hypothetical protein
MASPAKAKRTRPPHLRVSTGTNRCGNCAWYHLATFAQYHQGTLAHWSGICAMFNGYLVSSMEVCDSYERGKPGTKG